MSAPTATGLALHPFRAVRPAVDATRLARLVCPPYDVIDPARRAELLAGDRDNAVSLVLPEAHGETDAYHHARDLLEERVDSGLLAVDATPALYVYELRDADGHATRGLVGAVELHDAADGVILPHENTMAGPVADRLALMMATRANLEPIYLVYDGGGAASAVVAEVDAGEPVAATTTPDGLRHVLWAITDADRIDAVSRDLAQRRAVIADGHHRYATYLEMQRILRDEHGPGPWDRGLTLLVDSASYGPQVHAIHRVLVEMSLPDALAALAGRAELHDVAGPEEGLAALDALPRFGVVLSDGRRSVLVDDSAGTLTRDTARDGEPASLATLDVTVLHRTLVEQVWQLPDVVEQVGFAHTVGEAIGAAAASGGTAVLMRPTPVADVTAVAIAGARMPRKSTLFTPKPASGLLLRRFVDES
jgi:uncharacterized protein (DUF1015 family)